MTHFDLAVIIKIAFEGTEVPINRKDKQASNLKEHLPKAQKQKQTHVNHYKATKCEKSWSIPFIAFLNFSKALLIYYGWEQMYFFATGQPIHRKTL